MTISAHRKVVTVVFCDVVGSTALGESVDPEALQELLARYFERMKGIVESHGGSVEKFIGDAVMAVFGVPVVHEDDALRACREAAERSHASGFVGRAQELQQLADAWDRALAGPRCELVTVVGDPGVGKSRLVAEALGSLDARVVRGRCLPYGEGITYWPVIEVVKQFAALPSDPAAAVAVRSLLGESDQGTSADQIAWAFRKLLEEQAPLVVAFDDIQWGEETFLDLVEAAALLTSDAPILLLCMARLELLERRPAWPGRLRLEPLSEDEADELIRDQASGELRDRIAHAAGGNPLF